MTTFLEAVAQGRLNLETPLVENDSPHFEALGRFIVAYANAETAVHLLARRLSGLSDTKARAVFGGMRLTDVIDRLRAIARADKLDRTVLDEMEACLSQLNVIADKRHNMVHRNVTVSDHGQIQVTNLTTAKSLRNFQFEAFSLVDIERLRADCLAIHIRLLLIENDSPEDELPMSEDVRTEVYAPWRYIPVEPAPQNKRRHKARISPRNRP